MIKLSASVTIIISSKGNPPRFMPYELPTMYIYNVRLYELSAMYIYNLGNCLLALYIVSIFFLLLFFFQVCSIYKFSLELTFSVIKGNKEVEISSLFLSFFLGKTNS